MIKKFTAIFVSALLIVLCGCSCFDDENNTVSTASSVKSITLQGELRGVWISYIELEKCEKNKQDFLSGIDKMFTDAKNLGLNSVFVQVRPFADAIYPSEYFPWSYVLTGDQGKDPGYDPLDEIIKLAHSYGLQFHAWINPYRVSRSSDDPYKLSADNMARKWLTDSDKSNDDYAVRAAGGIYYNPAITEVTRLIVDGVREIVKNYDVDGIHFDDYFYPVTDKEFDSAAYERYKKSVSGVPLSLYDWRRTNVNTMIASVYSAVKAIDSSVVFGISPAANLSSNYNELYADISAWLSGGYIDYIMPQIYFGFEHPTEYARFDNMLESWCDLTAKSGAKLYIGLAAYKAGISNESDGDEWKNNDDILKRQIELLRNNTMVSGFVFFSYNSLFSNDKCNKAERENIVNLLK